MSPADGFGYIESCRSIRNILGSERRTCRLRNRFLRQWKRQGFECCVVFQREMRGFIRLEAGSAKKTRV